MKKIFILTGEPSGDKLASKVIAHLQKINPEVEYLSVGGDNLKSLGIKSIYELKDITYLGFTKVLFNLFKINNKINQTVKLILDFNPAFLHCSKVSNPIVGRSILKSCFFLGSLTNTPLRNFCFFFILLNIFCVPLLPSTAKTLPSLTTVP